MSERLAAQEHANNDLSRRLAQLEAMFDQQHQQFRYQANQLQSLQQQIFGYPTHGTSLASMERTIIKSPTSLKSFGNSLPPSTSGDTGDMIEGMQFIIPHEHTTSTNWLLSLPKIQELVGPYPAAYFHQIEKKNPLPPELSYSNRAFANVFNIPEEERSELIDRYFTIANDFYPVMDRQAYDARARDPSVIKDDLDPALDLLMCAIALLTYSDSVQKPNSESTALQYFASAMHIVNDRVAWSFEYTVRLAQALVLAASFLAHMGRPLHSWKHAQTAFSILKRTLPKDIDARLAAALTDDGARSALQQSITQEQRTIYWTCFLIEW